MESTDAVRYLNEVVGIGELPPELTEVLSAEVRREAFVPDSIVFTQGDEADRLFIVVEGMGELSEAGPKGSVPVTIVAPGDLVGELALHSHDRRRTLTLTAQTHLTLDSLSYSDVSKYLLCIPEWADGFRRRSDILCRTNFVKHIGPFVALDNAMALRLTDRLIERSFGPGDSIIEEGECGDSCFLLQTGQIEVVTSRSGQERLIATLGPGSLIGEAALLTDETRNATIRATEPTQVYELKRSDLDELLSVDGKFLRLAVRLVRLRDQPRRSTDVDVTERATADGQTMWVLKNREELTYYRLSERGLFIWDRLDGNHDLRSLSLAFFERFGELAPERIEGIVSGLARTKMIQIGEISRRHRRAPTRSDRFFAEVRHLLEKEVPFGNVDSFFESLYRHFGWVFFTRIGRAASSVIGGVGFIAFIFLSLGPRLSSSHRIVLLFTIPGFVASVFLHEAGHALAVKAAGRNVNRGGVGWYWFGPMAFVDTSDMWLASQRRRIGVSLAGPFTDFWVAGTLSIAGELSRSDFVAGVMWSLAVPSYLAVLANLNPLMELDGYHVLTDVLGQPNLRRQSFRWMADNFSQLLKDRRLIREHRIEFIYSAAAILYVALVCTAIVAIYRLVAQREIADILPKVIAGALAWVISCGLALFAVFGVIGELRRKVEDADRRPRR